MQGEGRATHGPPPAWRQSLLRRPIRRARCASGAGRESRTHGGGLRDETGGGAGAVYLRRSDATGEGGGVGEAPLSLALHDDVDAGAGTEGAAPVARLRRFAAFAATANRACHVGGRDAALGSP